MTLCSRCKERPAVVYISKLEGDKMQNEGLCLRCAKELGIPQFDDIIRNSGMSEEDIEHLEDEMEGLMEIEEPENPVDSLSEGKTPQMDLGSIFRGILGNAPRGNYPQNHSNGKEHKKSDKGGDKSPEKKNLNQYCRNLTLMASEGKLDETIGREKEIGRVMQILCRRQKNNPCLIGEPGVGKTAIAEALAMIISKKKAPAKLENKEVWLLDLTALVAGTQFRGQFESRIKGLIEEVKALGNIILVIDEIHTIVSAGDAEGGMNAGNILKPALSRGEIQVIGATTLSEYRKYIEKDAALERRFQPVTVDEPSLSDTIRILKGIKGNYEKFHGIVIPDAILARAAILSERYITDRFLPDKAIDLIDEASSFLAMNSPVINEISRVSAELENVRRNKEKLEGEIADSQSPDEEKYRQLADVRSKELQLAERFSALSVQRDGIELSVNELAHIIELWTGVPASNITELEYERIGKLGERLRAHIVGQDEAIESVVRAIKRNRAGISYKRNPVSFIFAGPTGVGKTELVKTIASDLFSTPETLIRLDMSEFMEKHSVSRIVGSPPGYVGYDEAGQLTEKIRRKPYSVVLFDEIEKAHPDVLNILLQILDDGRITDAQGRTVNFENTVIVMTTNAGSTYATSSAGFSGSRETLVKERTMKALRDFLRPEFINRVDEIIVFNSLTKENFTGIARIMLDELKKALDEHSVSFSYSDEAVAFIADRSFDEKYGARNMRRYIRKNIEDVIAEKIISSYSSPVTGVFVGYDKDNDKLDINYFC